MSTRTDTRRAPARGRGTTAGTTAPASPAPTRRTTARPTAERARARAGAQVRAPRIPFVLLILCLLGGALVSLLVLRSVVAEGAFTIANLQDQNQQLSYEEQQLRSTVAHMETSERISEEAEAMGMEQGDAPLFLDPERGEIAGSAGSGE
ncbi:MULTISPECIES: hypothetical protein [Nocardiopsis]|uniref:Cell division protein FtsB n=1 Tax=Nocardiopsis sinuspersici TaxID=501010 RepID=A0A1V3BXH4_9ACTN|nr:MULTISPECIES: hypothetical protein [Nocardiopsis]NYH54343.1 cell division protein FtsB [Nocardiopsis sinuspersici]OOC53148.1 hypothetical protein NOSIN_04360 [Nocardiopsis sinuspersici]